MVDEGFVSTQPGASGAWGYRSYREHLAWHFPGLRVRKLCLDAGFTCPNLDGLRGRGGCAYCNNSGFVPGGRDNSAVASVADLRRQWDRGRIALRRRHRRVDGFIAYFQAFSNSYAAPERLAELYEGLVDRLPECVGISISTRPDCIAPAQVPLWRRLAAQTFCTIELGLQSDRDAVLQALNRGHDSADFLRAVDLLAGYGGELCGHFMLGLPGEGADAPERLGCLAASLPLESVKLHNLHIMRGTRWARDYRRGQLQLPDRRAYVGMVRRFLACLRVDQSVQRIVADAPDSVLLSDDWCQDKQGFLRCLATVGSPLAVAEG